MGKFGSDWGNPALTTFVEVPEPEAVSWLPQTTGWLLLLLVLVLGLAWYCWRLFQHYQKNRYRRDALRWLAQLDNANEPSQRQREALLVQLPALLRKTALSCVDRTEIAGLSGSAWEVWLDQRCPGCQFASQYAGLLGRIAYSDQGRDFSTEEITPLIEQVRYWVRYHRGRDD